VVEPEVIEEEIEEVDVAVTQDVLPPEPLPEIVEPIEPIEEKPEPEPEPEPKPEPVVEKRPVVEPPKQVEAPPPPMPKPQPPKSKVVKKPEPLPEPPPKPVETLVAMTPPSVSGTEGKAGTQASRNAGNANDTTGGGIPGELVDYMSVLQAWLEKHKEYPRRARLRRIEGTTLLYFVMTKGGKVIDFRIQRSSGFSMLDHEVEEMIQRVQPLPRIPDDMKRDRLELVVPVQFMLR
jgi:protein TonB